MAMRMEEKNRSFNQTATSKMVDTQHSLIDKFENTLDDSHDMRPTTSN